MVNPDTEQPSTWEELLEKMVRDGAQWQNDAQLDAYRATQHWSTHVARVLKASRAAEAESWREVTAALGLPVSATSREVRLEAEALRYRAVHGTVEISESSLRKLRVARDLLDELVETSSDDEFDG